MGLLDDDYTKVLLHFDGSDGSSVFTDESGKTWTVNGNAQIDTGQSKFGGASGLFDGVGDYITTPNSSDFDFGTGDWTIDFWFRMPSLNSGYVGLLSTLDALNNGYGLWFPGYELSFYRSSPAVDLVSGSLTVNTWYHMAVVRNGNTLSFYKDGVSVDSEDVSGVSFDSAGGGLRVGRVYPSSDGYYFNGWVDELRISKGIARWTANFTVPIAPYGVLDQGGFLALL